MHWFESQLKALNKLADKYVVSQKKPAANIVKSSADMRKSRSQFIEAVQALVDNVSKVKGIAACAAYHDGLILAHSNQALNIDAFGATVQESLHAAQQGAEMLNLGDIEQIVIVGANNKVAMLSVGPLMLCIACPKHISLASALRQDT